MMGRGRRDSKTSEEFRELRAGARDLAAPPAPDGLIAQIVAERQRGVRAAIPDGEPVSAHPLVRRTVVAAAAAVLIGGLVALSRWPATNEPAAREGTQGVCAMNPETRGWLVASSFLLATACAQEPGAVPSEPAAPAVQFGTRALQGGTWVYRVGRQNRSTTYQVVYSLTKVETGEQSEWRSVSSLTNPNATGSGWRGLSRADTVYFAPDGLTPRREASHSAHGGQDRWVTHVTFGPDSVNVVSDYLGYRDSPPQRRRSAVAIPDQAPFLFILHDPALGYFLRRLPLAAGWSGSVRSGPFGDRTFRPTSLEVEGAETVTVPAGVFDCWRIAMTIGSTTHEVLWVSKDRQTLVKSVRGPEGYGLERALVSFTP